MSYSHRWCVHKSQRDQIDYTQTYRYKSIYQNAFLRSLTTTNIKHILRTDLSSTVAFELNGRPPTREKNTRTRPRRKICERAHIENQCIDLSIDALLQEFPRVCLAYCRPITVLNGFKRIKRRNQGHNRPTTPFPAHVPRALIALIRRHPVQY